MQPFATFLFVRLLQWSAFLYQDSSIGFQWFCILLPSTSSREQGQRTFRHIIRLLKSEGPVKFLIISLTMPVVNPDPSRRERIRRACWKTHFFRLIKNAPASAEAATRRQADASWALRNPVCGGARNPEEWGVLECTLQRRRMRGTPQMGVFQQPVRIWSRGSGYFLFPI